MDRSRCLKILEVYGLGPNTRRLLTNYWHRLIMVIRAGGYYGMTFGGDRGVTQGNSLFPTIFNVIVDAVVQKWENGFMEEAEARGERGPEGRHQTALFSAARRNKNIY